jgi:hypothetical protein
VNCSGVRHGVDPADGHLMQAFDGGSSLTTAFVLECLSVSSQIRPSSPPLD